MKRKSPLINALVTSAGLFAAVSLQGTVMTIFEGAGDLGNFTEFNGNPPSASADTVEVTSTVLDGVAFNQFDNDSGGRTTLRYLSESAFTEGIQVSFDVVSFSTGSEGVFRIGPDGASLASGTAMSLGLRLVNDGTIIAEANNASLISFNNAFTSGTAFNFSVIYNTSGSTLDLSGDGGPVLAQDEWAFFVDGQILDNGSVTSANLTERNLNVSGAQDMWWLTGNPSSGTGANLEYDNVIIATGADISVPVPEPSVFVLFAGIAGLGFVLYRRRRS